MKNILIITAHPSPKGFTHMLAKHIEKKEKVNKNTVEVIDLYKTQFSKEYVHFSKHPKEICEPKHIQEMQEKVDEADEFILIAPMWNLDTPAIMKNWFDSVFTAQFAFKFTKLGIPKGLMKGKSVRMYITCDAQSIMYRAFGNPTKKIWKRFRFGICGIKMKEFRYIDTMRKKSHEQREELLQEIY